ncbi:hypothetical protein KCU92_g5, partial [Aureobasidium melanogenum]
MKEERLPLDLCDCSQLASSTSRGKPLLGALGVIVCTSLAAGQDSYTWRFAYKFAQKSADRNWSRNSDGDVLLLYSCQGLRAAVVSSSRDGHEKRGLHLLRLVHAVLDNHVFVVFSWGQDLYYDLSSGLQQKLAGSLATFNVLHFVSTASLMILQSSVAAVSTYLVRSSNVLEVVHLMHSDIHLVLDNEVKELIGILLKFLSRRDSRLKTTYEIARGGTAPLAFPKLAMVPLRARQSRLRSKVALPTPSKTAATPCLLVTSSTFALTFLGEFQLLLCARCSDDLRTNSGEQLTQPQANTSSGSMNQNPIPLLHMISLSDQSQSSKTLKKRGRSYGAAQRWCLLPLFRAYRGNWEQDTDRCGSNYDSL